MKAIVKILLDLETSDVVGYAGSVSSCIRLADSTGVSTSVRPGRIRNRSKTEVDEKIKKPVDSVRKKTPASRKAPSRGRYVDEYARPAH